MKQLYLIFLLLPLFAGAQRAQIGGYFTCDFPVKSVMPKMSTNGGIGTQLAYRPVQRIPLYVELKGSLGMYSNCTLQQTYYFDSVSSTNTDVTYTSAMNRLNLGLKTYLVNDYRAIRPFITPQIGAAFMRSKIVIADPADEDDCKALERKTVQRYRGFTYGGEVGVDISMNKLFPRSVTDEGHKLYLSVNFTQSFNTFEYVNVKYMQDHDHAALHNGTSESPSTNDGRDINATFINMTTNSLHDHKIAELYHTDLRMIGFNIGYVYHF